jgi:hypothetical protein
VREPGRQGCVTRGSARCQLRAMAVPLALPSNQSGSVHHSVCLPRQQLTSAQACSAEIHDLL